jgi:hypothetical protein
MKDGSDVHCGFLPVLKFALDPFKLSVSTIFIEWIEKNTEDSIEHHEIRLNA